MTFVKKELFNEFKKGMEQALAHAQGKITLRTTRRRCWKPTIGSILLAAACTLPAVADDLPLQVVQAAHQPNRWQMVLSSHRDATGEVDHYEYRLEEATTKKVVLVIPCTYQPDEGAEVWARQNAESATVYWSPDGRLFALDEGNYRFRGDVFIVDLAEPANPQTRKLGRDDIAGLFPQKMERWRIRIEQGWIDDHRLSLTLGLYLEDAPGHRRNYIGKATATFDQGRIVIVLGPENKDADGG